MQNYLWRKLESSLFTGKSGKIMRQNQASFTLACYLICCQQSTDIGIFRFEPDIECVRMGLTEEECQKALATCIESGFCKFDDVENIIYIPNYTKIQIGALKERDHRRRGLHKTLKAMPEHPFVTEWIAKYKDIYGQPDGIEQAPSKDLESPSQAPSKDLESPSQAPSKGLQSAKKEEQKQEDTYPGEHVMGRLSEEEKAEGYAFLERQNAEAAAERERKRAELIASNEAKKQQAPSKDLESPSQAPSKGLLAREETETETETETEEFSKENSMSILQTGNQPGGDLLAGAPVLPSADIGTPGDMAKVVDQLQRLGIEDDLEDGARWLAKFFGKKLGSVAIALSTIPGTFDPESEEARTVRGSIKPWQGWIAANLPGEL